MLSNKDVLYSDQIVIKDVWYSDQIVIKDVWYSEASGGKWNPPLTLHEYHLPPQADDVEDYLSFEWKDVNHANQ